VIIPAVNSAGRNALRREPSRPHVLRKPAGLSITKLVTKCRSEFAQFQSTTSTARSSEQSSYSTRLSNPVPRNQRPDFPDASTRLPESQPGSRLNRISTSHITLSEAGVRFGVLLFRVEGLDRFRSGFGPEAANGLLRVVARTIEGTLWRTDFIGRWADDQFLVVLNGCR